MKRRWRLGFWGWLMGDWLCWFCGYPNHNWNHSWNLTCYGCNRLPVEWP